MLSSRSRVILCLVFCFGTFLRLTGYTSADLFAQRLVGNNRLSFTTLSFLAQNTANNTPLTRFLDIAALLPHGFAISSIRIQKTGNLSSKYSLTPTFTTENEPLCQSLTVKLIQNETVVFRGYLKDLAYNSTLSTNSPQDWILVIGLDDNSPGLMYRTCLFDLNFHTWRQDPHHLSGIYAQQRLSNSVTSGNW